jgi:hypothetical protein
MLPRLEHCHLSPLHQYLPVYLPLVLHPIPQYRDKGMYQKYKYGVKMGRMQLTVLVSYVLTLLKRSIVS